jgi:tetratricopeptide (TPR) repeat protein
MKPAGFLSSFKQMFIPAVVGLSLVVCLVELATALDQRRDTSMRAEQLAYLPKGEYLRLAVLGYRQLVADIIWMQAVQHIGAKRDSQQGYTWTYHAVDVATDLDPHFVPPYQATGVFLGVIVGHHDEAIAILTKGMRHNPEVWQLPFLAGYIAYYELCDPVAASKFFRVAAQVPGAPAYLPKLAARMTVVTGDPDAALEFLDRFSRSVSDERLREALTLRMKEVLQERDLRLLENSISRYYEKYQRFPSKPDDLLLGGVIQELPSDPLGGEYHIDFMTGKVSASSREERLRVHEQVACHQKRSDHQAQGSEAHLGAGIGL